MPGAVPAGCGSESLSIYMFLLSDFGAAEGTTTVMQPREVLLMTEV